MYNVDRILEKVFPNSNNISSTYKNNKLYVKTTHDNKLYSPHFIDAADVFGTCLMSILYESLVSFPGLMTIENVFWRVVVFMLGLIFAFTFSSAIWVPTHVNDYIIIITINVIFAMIIILLQWQIAMNTEEVLHVPDWGFLFKFKFK